MNLEKFTDRAKGFLQAAQTVAVRLNHQRITPEHLLKALIEDNEGMAAGLIQRAGGDAAAVGAGVDAALAKIPGVSGSGAGAAPGLDTDLVRVLDQAEQVADRAGDSYVTVERMLLALALATTTAAGQGLKAAGVTPEKLNEAIVQLRRARGAFGERRERLRRDEEIRPRPDRGGQGGQARPGDRPRRGNPPHDPDSRAADQEQSRADRRAGHR